MIIPRTEEAHIRFTSTSPGKDSLAAFLQTDMDFTIIHQIIQYNNALRAKALKKKLYMGIKHKNKTRAKLQLSNQGLNNLG